MSDTPELACIRAALTEKPTEWEYDSNQTPFYNDGDGFSMGGDDDGTYAVYAPNFLIDVEEFDGPVLSNRCIKKDAKYITACNPSAMTAVIAHIDAQKAEIERLRADADMFWNDDDSERQHSSISEFLNEEWCGGGLEVGQMFTLQRGLSLPKIRVKVTSIEDESGDVEYEEIAAMKEKS